MRAESEAREQEVVLGGVASPSASFWPITETLDNRVASGRPPATTRAFESGRPTTATTKSTRAARALTAGHVAADAVAIVLGLAISLVWLSAGDVAGHVRLGLASLPIWLTALSLNHLYSPRAAALAGEAGSRIARAAALAVTTTIVLAFAVQSADVSRSVGALSGGACAGTPRIRALDRRSRDRSPAKTVGSSGGWWSSARTGMLSDCCNRSNESAARTSSASSVRIGQPSVTAIRCSAGWTTSSRCSWTSACNDVIISTASVHGERLNRMTRDLTDAGYHVSLYSGLRDIDVARLRPHELGGRTMVHIDRVVRDGWRAVAKRVLDVDRLGPRAACSPLPSSSSPWWPSAWSPKAASSSRSGGLAKDGRLFRMFKLRTMSADAEMRKAELMAHNEADGPLFKMAADPRITRVGSFLRKTSIDELPQLVNVLRGEMSLSVPVPRCRRKSSSGTTS